MATFKFLKRDPKKHPVYNKHQGIIYNGKDNGYPNETEEVIANSPIASQCAGIYADFLEGSGFSNEPVNLSKFQWINYNQNDLLKEVCESLSVHQGAFIHISYNANFEKSGFATLPYENCRISKIDSQGYHGFVYHDSDAWIHTKYGRRYNTNIIKYHSYNPDPNIVEIQVNQAGGIEKYSGQVFYLKLSNKYAYTSPLISPVWDLAKADHELGLYYLNTIQNNFHDPTIVRHRQMTDEKELNALDKTLKEALGARNASSIIRLEDNFGGEDAQGMFKIEQLKTEVKPDKFLHIETTIANKIRKVYKNIPPQLTDFIQGKLGNTSGEDLIKANSVYNKYTASNRKKIERNFAELFSNFHMDIGDDWTIGLYEILEQGTINTDNNNTTPNA